MNFTVVNSSQLGRTGDNPHQRWDAGYHLFLASVRKGEATITEWANLLPTRAATEWSGKLRQASTCDEVHQILKSALKLIDLSPEVDAGLLKLAIRHVEQRAADLLAEADRITEEATRLRADLRTRKSDYTAELDRRLANLRNKLNL